MAKNKKERKAVSSYHETRVGKILYRVTSVFLGDIDLDKALEDFAINKILNDSSAIQNIIM